MKNPLFLILLFICTSSKSSEHYRTLHDQHLESIIPDSVRISFKKERKSILVSYTDNGKGATLSDKKLGNGLQNVENRIYAIHGSFTFTTRIGDGFKAEIKFPN